MLILTFYKIVPLFLGWKQKIYISPENDCHFRRMYDWWSVPSVPCVYVHKRHTLSFESMVEILEIRW